MAQSPDDAANESTPQRPTAPARPAVLVLGGQGVLGSVLARAFADAGWNAVRAGRRPQSDSGIRLADLDRPETVRDALDGVDVVVNPIPDTGLTAERVVLEHGPALINVSAAPAAPGWALQQEARGGAGRGLVLIHAGLIPGVTSLVAAELLRAHPDADEVEIAFGISARATSGKAGSGLIHAELTVTPTRPTFRAALGPPLGTRTCFEIAEDDRGWLAEGVRTGRPARVGIYFRERPLQGLFGALNRLRLLRAVPRATFVAGRSRVPREASREPVVEWVAVRCRGERVAARVIEGEGDYRTTAEVTVVFADALLELRAAQPDRSGVFAPEELFELEALRPALERRGVAMAAR